MKSPSDIFFDQYKAAAAEGAVVELKMRLLADKIPALQQYAHAQRLEDIEKELASHFGDHVSDEERKTLALCRKLRNKILHCDFSEARKKLNELGVETQSSGVKRVSLAGLSQPQMIEKITNAAAGNDGTFNFVANSSTSNAGSVFGWLLEMGTSGDFTQAIDVFGRAVAIVNKLLTVEVTNAKA